MAEGASIAVVAPEIRPPVVVIGGGKVTRAILGVMGRCKELPKSGYNKEGKYEYPTSNDVLAVTQDAMAAEGLVLTPREVDRKVVSKILFIKYEFDAKCEDETIVNLGSHSGACRFEFKSGATDDKAANKCMVNANKCYTLTLFRIPAGDLGVDREEEPDSQPIHDDRSPDERRETRRDDRGNGSRGGNGGNGDRVVDSGWGGGDRGYRREDAGQGEPSSRRDDGPRQESRGQETRGRGFDEDPPIGRWDDSPGTGGGYAGGNGGPLNGHGAAGRQGGPVDAEEADFRGKIMALKEGIERATREDDAHDMWRANADLVRRATSSVRAHLEATYEQVHRIKPPTV
jgi:hypothetical protein